MELLHSWYRSARDLLVDDADVVDGHTHTGVNDPDGVIGTVERLVEKLNGAGHVRAVVTTSQDPNGYRDANDRVLRECRQYPGRLVPFARVDPRRGQTAVVEAERSLDAGHRGLKLHPRAEQFRLADPTVVGLAEMAAERSIPLLVHAGRGVPSLGEDALALVSRFGGLRLILAHAGLSDLSWLGPTSRDFPGLLFDTSWWDITDLLALFAWVPPEQIVYASDTPYGHPELGFILTMRAAVEAGCTPEQLRAVFGGTMDGVLTGNLPDHGTAQAARAKVDYVVDPGLLRVHASLHGAIALAFSGADCREAMELARLGCVVSGGAANAPIYAAIAETLDQIDLAAPGRRHVIRPLIVLAAAALTPTVPVPSRARD